MSNIGPLVRVAVAAPPEPPAPPVALVPAATNSVPTAVARSSHEGRPINEPASTLKANERTIIADALRVGKQRMV